MSNGSSDLTLQWIKVTCRSFTDGTGAHCYRSFAILGCFYDPQSKAAPQQRTFNLLFEDITSTAFALVLLIASLDKGAMTTSKGQSATLVGGRPSPASTLYDHFEKLTEPLPDWLKMLFRSEKQFNEYKERSFKIRSSSLKDGGKEYVLSYFGSDPIKVEIDSREASFQERIAICRSLLAQAKLTTSSKFPTEFRWGKFELPDFASDEPISLTTNLWINAEPGLRQLRGKSEDPIRYGDSLRIHAESALNHIYLLWCTFDLSRHKERATAYRIFPHHNEDFDEPVEIQLDLCKKDGVTQLTIPTDTGFPVLNLLGYEFCILLSSNEPIAISDLKVLKDRLPSLCAQLVAIPPQLASCAIHTLRDHGEAVLSAGGRIGNAGRFPSTISKEIAAAAFPVNLIGEADVIVLSMPVFTGRI